MTGEFRLISQQQVLIQSQSKQLAGKFCEIQIRDTFQECQCLNSSLGCTAIQTHQ
jgi:hypothetical protein